ncbi:MAG: protein-glutamate O-methyltransferase family protein, partial [Anaerolineae bacterium]|nr:protein-glutamate O-methyltransferase family protein [Anaerolineae bacterium]
MPADTSHEPRITANHRESKQRSAEIRGDSRRLPPPLMTSEPGSFARKTIVERKGQIIDRVIADNGYPPDIVSALEAFREEIARPGGGSSEMRPLQETGGDAAFWQAHLTSFAGRTWLEVPWYFAEAYFYRRLLEAVRYFQSGLWAGHDPFGTQKRVQEEAAVTQLAEIWPTLLETPLDARFTSLLHASLWGNRADLSNFTVRERAIGDTVADRPNILIDDTEAVRAQLADGVDQVAFINDNVGADALFDLVLADHLLVTGKARRVVFYLKNQPFFVSDAMPQDIMEILARLGAAVKSPLAALGERLGRAMVAGHLVLTTDRFWTRCLPFRAMPPTLMAQLASADLVILKGDVNYRRLLDDRHWPPTTPLRVAAGDFPRPFLVLRTLKGEIIVGL